MSHERPVLRTDRDKLIADLAREMYRAGQAVPDVPGDEYWRLNRIYEEATNSLWDALAAEADNG